VPSAPSSTGSSERIVGRWLAQNKGARKDLVISSGVCGFSDQITWCRKGGEGTRLNRAQIMEAVDGTLARLGTDYIDLLQLHWPERYVPLHGAEYQSGLERSDAIPIAEQLAVMAELIKSGKVRSFGLSNETPYGVAAFTASADLLGVPRPVCTQNTYNLLVRNDIECGMVEACSPVNGNVALLACSPLAGGALSGKYLSRSVDPESRMRRFVGYMTRFISEPAVEATRLYKELADEISMPLAPVALSWVYSRPHVTATVIGATSLSQLEDNVMALNIPVGAEVEAMVNRVHRKFLDPTKGVFEIVDPFMEYTDPSKLPWGGKDQDVDPELDILINQRLLKF
jgi:aryl-alcohol dehydrogenase-like predicted oxidoreductase